MPKVAVVGAGTAGIEAASVAERNGAQVTIFEAGNEIPVPKSSWPSLLESEDKWRARSSDTSMPSAGVEVQLNQRVSKVGDDLTVFVGGRPFRFDSVVLSSGSAALAERLEGYRKRGVHVLDSRAAFAELAGNLGSYGKAVVSGSGPVAVEVAEKLRSRRLAVSMMAPGGVLPMLNEAPKKVVMGALSSLGVQVIDAKPERIAGVESVEAVVASGDVTPADCVAIVPRLVPRVPELHAGLGRSGGLVVDERMQSSRKSLYGAGDCAEVGVGKTTISVMFESSARLMGAVAGANASGKRATANVVGSFFMELIGIGIASAGLGYAEAVGLGLEVAESTRSWKGDLACSLVFSRGTRIIVGAQLAGKSVVKFAESLPVIVAGRMTMDQIAYQETLASSDISPITETAREGSVKR